METNRLVEVVIDDSSGVPKTLVEKAVALKKAAEREARQARDQNLRFDEVWCVFDVDEHPKIAEARNQARDHGISIAVSNPCFELWILLHFRDQRSHIERDALFNLCCEELPRYNKNITVESFAVLMTRYEKALERARALELWQSTRSCEGCNPSTDVLHLTERLRDLGRDAHLRRVRALSAGP